MNIEGNITFIAPRQMIYFILQQLLGSGPQLNLSLNFFYKELVSLTLTVTVQSFLICILNVMNKKMYDFNRLLKYTLLFVCVIWGHTLYHYD